MNEIAEKFLATLAGGGEFPGGMSYRKAIGQCNLDYSPDSLKRIDMLLDQIRARQGPKFEAFIKEQANQNFLYLLGFYVGGTIARNNPGARVTWISHKELVARDPALANVWPYQFESSVICEVAGGGARQGQFLPLSSIVIRLFEGPDEKSVWFSADAYMTGAAPKTPLYYDGQEIQKNDALLYQGGLYPGRVEGFSQAPDGSPVLLLEDPDGRKGVAVPAVKERLVLVERNTKDFGFAGLRWLKDCSIGKIKSPAPYDKAHASYALGNLFWTGVLSPRSAERAIELWLVAAAEGNAEANYQMGAIYVEGEVFRADPQKAVQFLNRAAEKGHADAQGLLGHLRLQGQGISRDPAQGVAMLQKAASAGSARAQFWLGQCYQDGNGVPQDHQQCVHWYTQAAAQGLGPAINNLADKYENGTGVAQDLQKAFALYSAAAERNVLAAWYSLGVMYQEGRGVAQDTGKAIEWLQRAAQHGFLDSAQRLEALRRGGGGGLSLV